MGTADDKWLLRFSRRCSILDLVLERVNLFRGNPISTLKKSCVASARTFKTLVRTTTVACMELVWYKFDLPRNLSECHVRHIDPSDETTHLVTARWTLMN